MPEKYIQLFNAAEQSFFVGMDSGKASWLIDEGKIHLLVYAAHPAEDGKYYYEDLRTQAVSWSLPLAEMTASAANTAKVLMTFNEEESEEWIGDIFPADASALLSIAIDAFLLGEGGDYDEDSAEEEDNVSEPTPEKVMVPAASVSPPSNNIMNKIFSIKPSDMFQDDSAKVSTQHDVLKAKVGETKGALSDDDSGSESGSDSGSGGTAYSDDETHGKHAVPATPTAPEVDVSVLTNDLILSQNTVKSSKMMVLAKGTFRNWKERYTFLRTHHIAYYEDPSNLAKAEAEIQINSTVTLKHIEQKSGAGIKIANAQDSMSIALSDEDERDLWMELIQNMVRQSSQTLKGYANLVPLDEFDDGISSPLNSPGGSTANMTPKKTSLSKKNKKYFILSRGLLTCHPDEACTSVIDSFLELNDFAVVEQCDDTSRTIALRHSEKGITKRIVFQFSLSTGSYFNLKSAQEAEQQQYGQWRNALQRLLPIPVVTRAPLSPVTPATSTISSAAGDATKSTAAPTNLFQSPPARAGKPSESEVSESEGESNEEESEEGSQDSGFGHEHHHHTPHKESVSAAIDSVVIDHNSPIPMKKANLTVDVASESENESNAESSNNESHDSGFGHEHRQSEAHVPVTPTNLGSRRSSARASFIIPAEVAESGEFSDSHSDSEESAGSESSNEGVHNFEEAELSDGESKKKAELEAARLAEEISFAAEVAAARAEEEQRLTKEAERKAEALRAAAAAEKARAAAEEETARIAAEEKRIAEAKKAAAAAEEARLAKQESDRLAAEAETRRLEDEKRVTAERIAAAKAKAEADAKLEAARIAEEEKLAAEARRVAEEERLAAEQKALAAQAEAARIAELAAEARRVAEEERLAAEQKALAAQAEAARVAEEEKLAAEARRIAEEERLAAEQKALVAQAEAARVAEEEKLAAEARRVAKEERLAAEQKALVAQAEAARIAAEEKLAAEARRVTEEERLAAEQKALVAQAEAARIAAEEKLAAEARRVAEEERLAAEQRALEEDALRIADAEAQAEAARLVEEEHQASERRRVAERVEADRVAELTAARAEEERRLAAEAEELRLLAEKQIAEKAEADSIAEAEVEASRNEAEELRIQAELQAARLVEEQRVVAEIEAARLAQIRHEEEVAAKAEASRLAEVQRIESEAAARKEKERMAAEKEAARAAEIEAARVAQEKRATEEKNASTEKPRAKTPPLSLLRSKMAAKTSTKSRPTSMQLKTTSDQVEEVSVVAKQEKSTYEKDSPQPSTSSTTLSVQSPSPPPPSTLSVPAEQPVQGASQMTSPPPPPPPYTPPPTATATASAQARSPTPPLAVEKMIDMPSVSTAIDSEVTLEANASVAAVPPSTASLIAGVGETVDSFADNAPPPPPVLVSAPPAPPAPSLPPPPPVTTKVQKDVLPPAPPVPPVQVNRVVTSPAAPSVAPPVPPPVPPPLPPSATAVSKATPGPVPPPIVKEEVIVPTAESVDIPGPPDAASDRKSPSPLSRSKLLLRRSLSNKAAAPSVTPVPPPVVPPPTPPPVVADAPVVPTSDSIDIPGPPDAASDRKTPSPLSRSKLLLRSLSNKKAGAASKSGENSVRSSFTSAESAQPALSEVIAPKVVPQAVGSLPPPPPPPGGVAQKFSNPPVVPPPVPPPAPSTVTHKDTSGVEEHLSPVYSSALPSTSSNNAGEHVATAAYSVPSMGFMACVESDDEEIVPVPRLQSTASAGPPPAPAALPASNIFAASKFVAPAMGFLANEDSDTEQLPVSVVPAAASGLPVKDKSSAQIPAQMGFMSDAVSDSEDDAAAPPPPPRAASAPTPVAPTVITPVVTAPNKPPALSSAGFLSNVDSNDDGDDTNHSIVTEKRTPAPVVSALAPAPAPPGARHTNTIPVVPPPPAMATIVSPVLAAAAPPPPVVPPKPVVSANVVRITPFVPPVPPPVSTASLLPPVVEKPIPPAPPQRSKTPDPLSPSQLREQLKNLEVEMQISKSELLNSLYFETKRTPMGRVVFERYKSSEAAIDVRSMQAMSYEFGVYLTYEQMQESVRKYASLPEGKMIYQDFMIWWLQNEQISNVKLNDPAFNRRNHAILCFKRLDTQMLGYVTFEQFRVLYPMLQQNELIGYKTSMESALMKLDPQQEQLVRIKSFLNWIALQDPSDGKEKTPLQRLFGEVARRNSSAIYMPSPAKTPVSPNKSIITPPPRPSTRASTVAPFATAPAPEERPTSPGSAVSLKERVSNRAAAVKKFIGGAAIGGVVRQQAAAYVDRDEADHTPLSQSAGKFAKAFDLQLLESIMHPAEPSESETPAMVDLEEDFEEEKEVWELKTEGIPNPVLSGDKRISRRFSLLPIPQDPSSIVEEVEEETIRAASLAPLKSALRSRSSSPTATRKHVASSPGGVRFIPGEKTPEPSHRAKGMRNEEFFLAPPSISKVSTIRGAPSPGNKQVVDSKASGVFLSTCGDDAAEDSASKSSRGSDSEDELSDTESRALYDEAGEFTQSHIKASVEAMFAFHSYVSPFKASSPPRPPPPPPPPGASHRGSTATVNDDSNVFEAAREAESEEEEEEEQEFLQEELETSDEDLNDTFFLTVDEDDHKHAAANELLEQTAQSQELSVAPQKASERSASPSKIQAQVAVALPPATPRQVAAAKDYATAVDEPPEFSPSHLASPPVTKFEPPSISVTIPDPVLTEKDASVTADKFLRESNRVLSSTVSQMRSLANSKNLKVRNGSPIVSRKAISKQETLPESTDLQLNGHGKLDAYEQLVMERMSIAEAVIKLQELEDQSLSRIMKAEEESLRRIQAEAVASVQHVRSVKHRLQERVATHLENVQKQTMFLSDMRRDLYARQESAAQLQRQRFDEVTQMATSLAEQQLHIAAERRRMAERQFHLQLSLEDLKQCAKSRSRSNSPQRSVYHPYSPAGTYSQPSPRHSAFPGAFSEERYFSPASPSHSARVPFAGFSEQNAPEQYLPSPQHTLEFQSPSRFQPAAASPTESHRSDAHNFDKQAPHWYSPVAPLAVRRDLTPPSDPSPAFASAAQAQSHGPAVVQEDLTSSQFPMYGEGTPASAPAPRRVRRSSVNYGDGPTNFPNALKAQNANAKKAFR